MPVPKAWGGAKWHEGIDPLLLAQSLDHLAQIEIRRGERELASKPSSPIEQFRPTHALTLTREAYLTRWRDTFWAWIYQSSNSAFEDAQASELADVDIWNAEQGPGPRVGVPLP